MLLESASLRGFAIDGYKPKPVGRPPSHALDEMYVSLENRMDVRAKKINASDNFDELYEPLESRQRKMRKEARG